MRVVTTSDMENINVNYIPLQTIMEKLNVRRNYIYKRIIPEVGHVKKGRNVYIDEDSLRLWLKNSATFSRQTILVKNSAADAYTKKLPSDLRKKLWAIRDYSRKRTALPFISVKPFDFWEKEIIHPALVVPTKYKTEELLYRDMFLKGAIKITLGRNKTMFYLEEDSADSSLFPAMGKIEEQIKNIVPSNRRLVEKPINIIARDCQSENDATEIIRFFREHQIKILQFFYDRENKNLHIEFNLCENKEISSHKPNVGNISYDEIPF